jgi:hypothetical protein
MKDSKAAKGIHKNSVTPSKDQTCESWVLKKEKRCKPKIFNNIIEENFPNLGKELSIYLQETSRTPNWLD